MPKQPLRILAINPGSRYLGIAVFRGPELLDWGVKIVGSRTPVEKRVAIRGILADFVEQYRPNILAIKKLHGSRSSRCLNEIVRQIEAVCSQRRIKIRRYAIGEIKELLCPNRKINKRALAGILAHKYPALLYDLERESKNQNPYRVRMFEAVALAAVCWQQIENK